MENFYDKVARKYGGYAFGAHKPKYFSEHPSGDPEKIFKDKLLELAGGDKIALDVGCGDCKFAFGIADRFREIVGIDTSKELLNIAEAKKEALKVANVSFLLQDAENTTFKDESLDIIYCRRGPSFLKEYYRLLRKGASYLEIGIGEKDAIELKRIFGRGQDFGKWDKSRLSEDVAELKKLGFEVNFSEEFNYSEYYPSHKDLEVFLQRVPIFEDFDPEKDREYLETYCKDFQTEKGIVLHRHRIVLVARKSVK